MDRRSDKALVAACRDGDQGAYGALIDRHYRRVFSVCLSVLGHAQDAEDAAQEAAAKGFERIGELRNGKRFGSWIARIGRNVSVDFLRRQERGRAILAERGTPTADSPSGNHDLAGAIRRLPIELREPLVMYYFGGRTAKAIAEALHISHTGACQRLREARKELHRMLTDEGDA